MRKVLNFSNKDNKFEIFQTNKSRKIDFFQTNNLII